MKKTKLLGRVIGVLLLAGMLFSCGGKTETATSQSGNASATGSGENFNPEAELLYWLNTEASSYEEQVAWAEDTSKWFAETTGGGTLRFEFQSWSDYLNKILVAIVSNEGPDLFQLGSTTHATVMATGGCLDITDDMDYFGGEDAFYHTAMWMCQFQGRFYGLPLGGGGRHFWYNKAMFAEAGVGTPDPKWTWDDFIAALNKLKATHGRPPFMWSAGNTEAASFWWNKLLSDGGAILNEDFTKAAFNSPAGFNATRSVVDLFVNELVPPSTYEITTEAVNAFTNGDISILWAPDSNYPDMRRTPIFQNDDNLGAVMFPYGLGDTHGYIVYPQVISIASYTKFPAEAKKVLQYTVSEEQEVRYNDDRGWIPFNKKADANPIFNDIAKVVTRQGITDGFPFPESGQIAGVRNVNTTYLRNLFNMALVNKTVSDEEIRTALKDSETEVNSLLAAQ